LERRVHLYESFFNNSGDAIFVHDFQGRFLDVNAEAARRLGFTREEFLEMSVQDIDAPEFAEQIPQKMEQLLKEGRMIAETIHMTSSGEMIPVELNATLIDFEGEKAIMSAARDLRDRKRTEEALEQSRERYRILFDGYSHPVVLYDREGKVLMANIAAAGYMGLPPTQCVGKYLKDLAPHAYQVHGDRIRRVVDEGVELHVEDLVSINKDKRWFWSILQPVADGSGSRIAAQVISYEITGKKRAEEALRESRARFRAVFESSSVGMCAVRPDGFCVMANSALAQMLGLQDKDLTGFDLIENFVGSYRSEARRNLELMEKGRRSHIRSETCLVNKDQKTIWLDISYSPLPGPQSGAPTILMAMVDISDRKEAETELKKSEQRHRRIIESITEGYYEVDLKGNIIFLNQSLCEISGYPSTELLGRNFRELVNEKTANEIYSVFHSVFESGEPVDLFEWTMLRKDGSIADIEASVSPITINGGGIVGFGGICRDVTEKQEARKTALQNERLRAVAELASGVSHNFNNLLQIVLGSAQLGQVNLELGNHPELNKNLDQIQNSARFGAETVKRLQHFARVRADKDTDENFDLSATVDQAVEMGRVWWQSIPEREGLVIEMEKSIEPNCIINGKESEIFEVVVNLVKNSAEALPGGGKIKVNTYCLEEQAVIEISDDGVGITPENLGKIFQPFFTTKGFQSTGMGLSSSHGIIQRHGGKIEVQSEPGSGATFKISLPLVAMEHEHEEVPSGELPWKLNILVIDDLAPLLRMLAQSLKRHDQNVKTAISGVEAIKLFSDDPPDLVICDLGMPGMNGWAICKELKRICDEKGLKKPPFIILTGWEAQDHVDNLTPDTGVDALLEKPVDISKLLSMVKGIYEYNADPEQKAMLRSKKR
jgi:PAS domain S-box-containing protein